MPSGYSQSELRDIQERWELRFPPDLIELLREHRRLISDKSFDWFQSDPEVIQNCLDWPFESFMFDVEHGVWSPEWGEKPKTLLEQRQQLREVFDRAPKLIPLFGHRYLPQEPFEAGNPVFSVYQTDVIYYGANLQDWMARETSSHAEGERRPWPEIKEIPFWSDVVRRNGTQD